MGPTDGGKLRRLWDTPLLLRWAAAALLATSLLTVITPGDGYASEQAIQGSIERAKELAVSETKLAIQRAQKLLDRYGYAAVFGVIFLEGIGIPAPGEMLVIAAAIDASRGVLNIALLLALTIAAAILGNSVGYAIGRYGGHRLLLRLPVSADRLARVSQLFDRYGGWFILVARFIDGPRQLNGIIAGTLKMPWWEFTFWNVLGAVLWVSIWGGAAYWFGHDIKTILKALRPVESILLGVLAVAIVAAVYLLWRRRVPRQAPPDP